MEGSSALKATTTYFAHNVESKHSTKKGAIYPTSRRLRRKQGVKLNKKLALISYE
jgi:hypothetical protein